MMTYDDAVSQVQNEAPDLTVEPFDRNIPNAVVVSKDGRVFSMHLMDTHELWSQSINLARDYFAK